MPDGRCSNCLAFASECTYVQPTRKRGPKNRLVEELKQKNSFLEAKLRSLSLCSLCSQPLQRPHPSSTNDVSVFSRSNPDTPKSSDTEPSAEEDDFAPEEFAPEDLAERFRLFSIDASKSKFFGSASSFALVSNAIAVKEKYLGHEAPPPTRRPDFWQILPWEKDSYEDRPHSYVYPDSDLISALLELYFANIHPILPILHRTSFERSVAEGLHLTNMSFGTALLATLGLGSRYSDDPRVFVDGRSTLSSGWPFVSQVQTARKLFEPTIYDVQFYCLMTLFSLGTSAPQAAWLYLGLGIRFLQQRGEHRHKVSKGEFNADEEIWRRAFWAFFSLDRLVCTFLGRPSGIQTEDCDVDYPLQIDDQYWDRGCVQPLGKPSLLSYFTCHLRLCEILEKALRRLYASKRMRARMGWTGVEWEQRTVAELDSAMNDFFSSVPSHLRWDPLRTSDEFFTQSAVLHATFYYIQIIIHRPYILRPTVLAAPSLAICASAARSILHASDIWLNKSRRLPLPFLLNPVFVAGVILTLSVFGTKHTGLALEKNKDLAHVRTAMEIVKFAESRWQASGRLWELLQELQAIDGRPPKNVLDSGPTNMTTAEPVMDGREVLAGFNIPPQGPSISFSAANLQDFTGWNGLVDSANAATMERLLAETEELEASNPTTNGNGWLGDAFIDDEFMSIWTAVPTDLSNVGQWDAYIKNNGSWQGFTAGFNA
ncbi:fungal-specific transcription factor domain-containing protein [Mycena crocata]|nr:fungal-specific transcription factor domain-containing protein [Mycena crocata]